MKQFKTVFSFEFKGYLKNKVFVGVTLFLVAVIAIVMFFPRITSGKTEDPGVGEAPVMLICVLPDSPDSGRLENFSLQETLDMWHASR